MANATVVQTLLIQGLVLLAFGFSLSSGQTTSKNVLCYYSYGSSDYRGVTFYNISDIDTSVCTHLVYHSTWFDGLHIQTVDHIEAWEQFKALKLSKPSLKTILSVGGLHNDIETQAFDYRLARIYYANMLLRSWDFDGIDLVWSRNITPAVVNFIEEMHQMFLNGAEFNQGEPLILMFSVPERIGVVTEEVDLHKLGQAVDILQVLTIGYTWPWDKTTGLSTPLYGDGSTYGNVSGSIFNYLDGGMPPEKVHMAIQLYATTFTLSNPELTGVGAPSSSIGYPGEYPVGFGKLTYYEEMHAAFAAEATSSGRDSLILMVKLHPWGQDGFAEGVDVQGLAEAVDILQIHTMQYSLGYYDTTGLSTPLYGHNRNVARSIMGFLDDGMTPEKLYMTIQLYAISFTLSDPELNGVGAPAIDEGKTGEYSRRPFGELTYYEVCKLLQEGGYTTKVDPEGLVNFAYKGDQWMTYEDPASLEIKMSFVYEHNLGGVAAEYLYDDDYTGQFCNGGRYPLLSTLYNYRPAISEMP